MTPSNPFAVINLNGDGTMRGVTLALPCDRVRDFLPAGMELGEQSVTPKGTHPLIVQFNDMYRLQFSMPSLLPSLTYHEHIFAVPYVNISAGSITPGRPGPYFFMAKLYLDSFLATLGGIVGWGFAKEMASFNVTADRYTITSFSGQRLTSLVLKTDNHREFKPIAEYAYFAPVREMLSQPVISLVPAALGPFFILSDFDKNWDVASVRPIETALEVDVAYVPGYAGGRYPVNDWSPGIDRSVLGSYELRAPWRLSLPYPPVLSFKQPA